ncbi:MAG: restriction endonuclease subunit S [Veillonella sp.]|uniref:restriction endonuclease subunit S n=1 Tax=Veillonella sp. TaxID=1926307 RepID=UPI00257E4B2F|nr:restriction endonuclease subunit S [Veillonella sp.]MBS7012658.1 restriction endonuclease subunit S [Veillonella sp.]
MGNKPRIRFKGFTEDWEQCKLGEFVNIVSGDAPSTFISGNCIYVKVDDLNYSDRIQLSSSNLVNANPKAHLVNTGATIFPKRGAAIMTNKVRIMGQDGYLDTNMMALIPKEIDKDFLFTFIQKTGLYKISDTSTIPQINNKHIEPYMIQVPTNKEQECIGVFFEKIDKIITLHQCKLEKLKLTKKALLQKLFPKNGKHIPEIRFKGFTDAWEQRKLISLYKTIRNAFVGTATPYYTNDSINGYFYLESNNVKNGKINRNNEIYITKDFYQKQEDKLLYKDDIVIVQSGHVGHTAVIPEELDKTAAHALIMLQNKKENFDSHFINNSFQTPLIRNKIDEITTGNTIKHILASDVKNIVINMPSFKEQKLISQLFKLLDLNITLHQRKLERLQEVKKGLLQKMFV